MESTNDEITELMLSELRGLHHMSLIARRRMRGSCSAKELDCYSKVASRASRGIFSGITELRKYKNNNTQLIWRTSYYWCYAEQYHK